ncbi:MAG: histidine--tRNA ligase [Clostridia bacterium]|nr:histidine--tRNA ligase [Clostridia bacterium]
MLTQAPRGTKDVTPEASALWQYVEARMRGACAKAGYREVRTPTFEHTELFVRGVGDTTDVVQKEMYTFVDKGGRSVTLKPEGTAGVVRMIIENRLYAEAQPMKLFYLNAPVFRYDKPQSGRFREHHQFGVEAFGAAGATVDAEQITLAWDLLQGLGLRDLRLSVNSIGCPACRPAYQQRMRDFLAERLDGLCGTCKGRFDRNPMRILDCKSPSCQARIAGAPSVLACLCAECEAHFAALQEALRLFGLPFQIDPGIVRGLDYYTKTVFEILTETESGPLALTGGGRYDLLVEQLGGPALPGVGFGMGMERVLMVMQAQGAAPPAQGLIDVFVCAQTEAARQPALALMMALRRAGVRADADHMGRSLKAQFKYADKCGARLVAVLGEEELRDGQVTLRDMVTREEKRVLLDEAVKTVKNEE